jgi:hypothetical protein
MHEEKLIKSFFLPERQSRYLVLLSSSNSKHRLKLRAYLAHCRDIDMRFAFRVPSKQQNIDDIYMCLKEKGAPDTCYVFSENIQINNLELPLKKALEETIGLGAGTFLSCIPGKLAYYEGEEPGERYICERKQTP